MKKAGLLMLLLAAGKLYAQIRTSPELESLLKTSDSLVLKQKLSALAAGTEADLDILLGYYTTKRNAAMRDSVTKLSSTRFPAGRLAFVAVQEKIRTEKDDKKLVQLYKEAKSKFPDTRFEGLDLAMALNYAEKKNLKSAVSYGQAIKSPGLVSTLASRIEAVDSSVAEKFVKQYLNVSVSDSIRNGISYAMLRRNYGNLLIKNGKYDEAYPYIAEAYEKSKGENSQLTKSYALLLEKKGRYEEAIPLLEKIVLQGKADPAVKASLRTAYNKTGVNAGQRLEKLSADYRQHVRDEVAKTIINNPAPSFVLKDVNGKDVSLADFKGKIIVVDFWATWCGPCKSSFPAMKTALGKYANDPNVKFLFVHTWEPEGTSPLKDASAYLKDNNYPFDLYIDARDPETKKSPVVSSFGVTGIPTKFIIDGNGNIRFSVRGFSGADEATVEELTAMIEMLKKG